MVQHALMVNAQMQHALWLTNAHVLLDGQDSTVRLTRMSARRTHACTLPHVWMVYSRTLACVVRDTKGLIVARISTSVLLRRALMVRRVMNRPPSAVHPLQLMLIAAPVPLDSREAFAKRISTNAHQAHACSGAPAARRPRITTDVRALLATLTFPWEHASSNLTNVLQTHAVTVQRALTTCSGTPAFAHVVTVATTALRMTMIALHHLA